MVINCPLEVFPGRAIIRTNLWLHFMHQHAEDTILVLNKGPGIHPQCEQCDMFTPRVVMAELHLVTTMCKIGSEQNCWYLAATAAWLAVGT